MIWSRAAAGRPAIGPSSSTDKPCTVAQALVTAAARSAGASTPTSTSPSKAVLSRFQDASGGSVATYSWLGVLVTG